MASQRWWTLLAPAAERDALSALRSGASIDVVGAPRWSARRGLARDADAGTCWTGNVSLRDLWRCWEQAPSNERPSVPRARLHPLPIYVCALLRACSWDTPVCSAAPACVSPAHIWKRLSNSLPPFLPLSLPPSFHLSPWCCRWGLFLGYASLLGDGMG